MNRFLKRAFELKDEMIEDRRYIHQNAERGMNLPLTLNYVKNKLEQIGCVTEIIGEYGLTAVIGDVNSENVILLRADMDALPMIEENDLEFKTKTDSAHCCGHDLHTAMLLTAARILKENENEIKGAVKLMFQPGEEVGTGAKYMVANGILNNPVPKAVMGMHVNAKSPLGMINYGKGYTFSSNNSITINVYGKGGHGARPQETVDPIKVACHIYMAIQSIKANSITPMSPVILTLTAINGGSSFNLIPDKVEIKGTLRTYDEAIRQDVIKQIREKTEIIASAFDAKAEVIFGDDIPPVICSEKFTDELLGYASEIVGNEKIADKNEIKMGSDDFAFVTERYPGNSAYLFIGTGPNEHEGYVYGQHSTKVIFNEDALPYGAAILAQSAFKWLDNHFEDGDDKIE